MSTSITAIYDQLHTKMGSLLPELKRLPFAYSLTENPDIMLKSGYAVTIGEGENTQRQIGGNLSIRRNFKISICQAVTAIDSDSAKKAATEKSLFESQLAIINDLEKDPTLNQTATNSKYVSDGGIGFIYGDNSKFLYIDTTISIEYMEPIT